VSIWSLFVFFLLIVFFFYFQACQDVLTQYYGQEQKDFVLPSDAHKVDQYTATPLAQSEVMI
jgi:hypothetical protein